jgi:hypothetical protein
VAAPPCNLRDLRHECVDLRRNLLVDPEVLFNRRDTDFELQTFVDLMLG